MKQTLKIRFSDFWDSFDPEDNFITDALSRHFAVELSEDPDFVFCGTFGRKYLKYDCVRIFFTGENLVPDFNLVDYGMGFHRIDFDDRYLRLPLYVLYGDACSRALAKHTKSDEEYLAHKKFCNYVVSNAIADPARDEMITRLTAIGPVDSGGKYRNNVGGPVPDKVGFEKDYRFTMCFENTCSRGYTTEKLIEAFAGDTVPIYWGNPDAAEEFNPDAFINCHSFPTLAEAAEMVRRVREDDELYLKMMKAPILGSREQQERKTFLASKYLEDGYLAEYLFRICSQDPEKAYRRNRIYQGLRYEQQAQLHQKIDRLLYLPRRTVYHVSNRIRSRKK